MPLQNATVFTDIKGLLGLLGLLGLGWLWFGAYEVLEFRVCWVLCPCDKLTSCQAAPHGVPRNWQASNSETHLRTVWGYRVKGLGCIGECLRSREKVGKRAPKTLDPKPKVRILKGRS